MNQPQSTTLENFTWQAGKLRLQAQGKAIDLSAEHAAPALEAFQAFYEEALNAYSAGKRVAPPPVLGPESGLAEKGGSWLNGVRRLFAHVLSWATNNPIPEPRGRHSAPEAGVPPTRVSASSGPKAAIAPTLALRSVFADPQGVHVVWTHAGSGGKSPDTELLYSFDSAVAERLQGCYGALKTMGIDVVDLQVWRKAPEVAPPPMPATATAHAQKPELTGTVMRLHPRVGDNPARALVSPLGDDKNVQVLSAPERLIAALHAAADPERPLDDRLTHLRCAPSRGGLKVIAVGLGQERDAPGLPARWENIAPWFEGAKKAAPSPARPIGPEPVAARSGPEPEFF